MESRQRHAVSRVLYNFLGLVIIAAAKHPIPSRTRPLSALALMVLRLKAWESKSSPNLVSYITKNVLKTIYRLSHPRVAFCVLESRVTLSGFAAQNLAGLRMFGLRPSQATVIAKPSKLYNKYAH